MSAERPPSERLDEETERLIALVAMPGGGWHALALRRRIITLVAEARKDFEPRRRLPEEELDYRLPPHI